MHFLAKEGVYREVNGKTRRGHTSDHVQNDTKGSDCRNQKQEQSIRGAYIAYEDVERDFWGLGYKIVTKKLRN